MTSFFIGTIKSFSGKAIQGKKGNVFFTKVGKTATYNDATNLKMYKKWKVGEKKKIKINVSAFHV